MSFIERAYKTPLAPIRLKPKQRICGSTSTLLSCFMGAPVVSVDDLHDRLGQHLFEVEKGGFVGLKELRGWIKRSRAADPITRNQLEYTILDWAEVKGYGNSHCAQCPRWTVDEEKKKE
jgi:hypothetical protein